LAATPTPRQDRRKCVRRAFAATGCWFAARDANGSARRRRGACTHVMPWLLPCMSQRTFCFFELGTWHMGHFRTPASCITSSSGLHARAEGRQRAWRSRRACKPRSNTHPRARIPQRTPPRAPARRHARGVAKDGQKGKLQQPSAAPSVAAPTRNRRVRTQAQQSQQRLFGEDYPHHCPGIGGRTRTRSR
jgi:hypothetical protein